VAFSVAGGSRIPAGHAWGKRAVILLSGFKITGRGFVIAGEIIEGTIRAGNRIVTHEIESLNGKMIKSVEFVDHIRTGIAQTGLMIPCQTAQESEALQCLDLQQKELK
jgi:GTPase